MREVIRNDLPLVIGIKTEVKNLLMLLLEYLLIGKLYR